MATDSLNELPRGFEIEEPGTTGLPPGFEFESQPTTSPSAQLPQGFEIEGASPSPLPPGMFDANNPPDGPDAYVAEKQIVNGTEYRRHGPTGTIYDPQGKSVVDPKVLEAFGKTKPTKMGQKLADADKQANQPGTMDYVKEFGRSTVRGAAGTTASIGRGLSVLTSDDSGEIVKVEQGIANLKTMSPEQATAFMRELPQRLSPAVAFNYQVAIRKMWNGDVEGAKPYLDQARKYTDTRLVEDQPLTKAADQLEKSATEAFPQDPRFAGSLTSDLGQGLGSTAAFLPIGILTGGTGVALTGAAAGADETYRSAKQDIGKSTREDRAGLYNAGLGTEAAVKALQAGRLGALPGASEVVPIESFLEQAPKLIPGLRTFANTPAWGRFAKAFGRIGTQVLAEGGQEAFQTWASNVINKITVDPSQVESEDVLYNAMIGGAVGGGMQIAAEGYGAVRGGETPPAPRPAPSAAPAPGTPPGAPSPRGGPRIEPRLFPGPVPPGFEVEPPISDDAYLMGAGYTAEQISDMNPEERAQAAEEARQQGVEPVDLMAGAPAPGAAPRAPRASAGPAQAMPPGAPPAADAADANLATSMAPAPGTAPMAPRGTRRDKVAVQSEQDLEAVRPTVNAEPSEAQAQAGNYQKGHIKIHGLDVSIENPRGSVRRGKDEDGKDWASPQLPADYGYIKGTTGKDGDHVDVYIGPNPQSQWVYVIDQNNIKTGKFDEHKSVLGASSMNEAVDLYLNSFDDPTVLRLGNVVQMSVDEFKQWVKDGKNTKRPAAKAGVGTVRPNVPSDQTEKINTAPAADFKSILQEELDAEFGAQPQPEARGPAVDTAAIDTAFSKYLAGRKPLNAEAFAQSAGIDPAEAGKALQRAALAGRIMQGRNGQWRRPPTRSTPINVIDFIASIGGISDPTGELAGMDLPKMGPFGPPVRKNGLHPDKVREALIERGYLRDRGWGTDQQQETTVNDVYDLIARHLGGQKVYSVEDQTKADDLEATRRADALTPDDWEQTHPIAQRWGEGVWDKIQQALADMGLEEDAWSPQEVNDAARMVAEGMDAGAAFERAALKHIDELDSIPEVAPEIAAAFERNRANAMVALEVPPFPDVEPQTNAVQQQGSPEAGNGVRPDGEGRQEPAREAEVPRPAAEVRGPREAGAEAGSEEPAAQSVKNADLLQRLTEYLDNPETAPNARIKALDGAGIQAAPVFRKLIEQESKYDKLTELAGLIRQWGDRLRKQVSGGKSKKAQAEAEATQRRNDRVSDIVDGLIGQIAEKRDPLLIEAMDDAGLKFGDTVRYAESVTDSRTGEDFAEPVEGEITLRNGLVSISSGGGIMFLSPDDIRNRVAKVQPKIKTRADDYVMPDSGAGDFGLDLNADSSSRDLDDPWTGVNVETLRHYAKNYDVETQGRRRADIIAEMKEKGAIARQGGGIIASNIYPGEIGQKLHISGSNAVGAKIQPKPELLEKFKDALTAHPETIVDRGYRNDPTDRNWRFSISLDYEGETYVMEFANYGIDGITANTLSSKKDGSTGRLTGGTASTKHYERFMREFLEKYPPEQKKAAPAAEKGADNKPQLVIPGAEQDKKGALQNAAKAPLKANAPQKGMDVGLFGSERDQTDMFDKPAPKKAEAKTDDTTARAEKIREKFIIFSSGMSRLKDFVSGAYTTGGLKTRGIGIDVQETNDVSVKAMAEKIVQWQTRVFIDSGAFGIFKRNLKERQKYEAAVSDLFQKEGATPPVIKEISAAQLLKRYDAIDKALMEVAEREGEEPFPQPLYVAPDIVGDQRGSIDLVQSHGNWIKNQLNRGREIIIPIQKGEQSLAEAYEEIAQILGRRDFVVGVPSNAKAVSDAEFAEFVAAAKPPKLHFLGTTDPAKIEPRIQAIAAAGYEPDHVSSDANMLRALLYGRSDLEETRDEAIRRVIKERSPEFDELAGAPAEEDFASVFEEELDAAFEEKPKPQKKISLQGNWWEPLMGGESEGSTNAEPSMPQGYELTSIKKLSKREAEGTVWKAGQFKAIVKRASPYGTYDAVADTRAEAISKALAAAQPKTAGQAAKSAAKNAAMGMGEIVQGLEALFGSKNKLSSGFTFDEDSYAKALPLFKAAVSHLGEAVKDMREVVRALIRKFRENGMSREAIENMAPYLERFAKDVTGGQISLEDEAPAAAETSESPFHPIVQAFVDYLSQPDAAFDTITEARKFAADRGFPVKPGTPEAKDLDEKLELAIVLTARTLVGASKNRPVKTAYRRLVDLYNRQPNLGVRTSESMADQAYSTPAPLAYIASRLAGVAGAKSVLEPTAGNGMLLIEASPANADVNELNDRRFAALKAQGFRPKQMDAATEKLRHAGYPVEVVIENPPFGAVKESDGSSKVFDVDGWATTQIDHAIALNTLKSMADNGRAVLIVGSVKEGTDKSRSDSYNTKQKREFYWRLYQGYNVTDHFTVSGDLYKRQGAGWPVDVIVIEGRAKSARPLPAVELPKVYDTWESLEEKLDEAPVKSQSAAGQNVGGGAVSQPSDVGNVAEDGKRLEGGSRRDQSPDGGRGAAAAQPAADGQGGVPVRGDQRQLDGAGKQQSAEPDGSEVAPGERSERGGDREPPVPGRERLKQDAEAAQQPYKPMSSQPTLDTKIPTNMADAVETSLQDLADRHGQLDAWVEKELGYKKGEIGKYLAAEQVDAVALALDNVQKNAAFIIGDQTGIGKGRVVASALRYAMRKGLVPIFVTEKPNLYGDIIRDLTDIGVPQMLGRDLKPFLTNSGEAIPLDDEAVAWYDEAQTAKAEGRPQPPKRGKFLRASGGDLHKRQMAALQKDGTGKDFDIIFTTYDQMNTVKGQTTDRRRLVDGLADRAFIVLDESHNAGGTEASERGSKNAPESRSDFLKKVTGKAKAVMFSSATYAKRPGVMALYARTDMGKAVEKPEMLGELISRGGVPMQQVVAAMLAKAGQYIRRERSFDGVSYDVEPVAVDLKAYEAVSTSLAAIARFDIELKRSDTMKEIKENLKENAEAVGMDTGAGEVSINSTNFTSLMHNIVNQMLLAIKVDAVASRAIEALKAGEKPVITVANTMGAFLKSYAEDNDLKRGDPVGLSFRDVLDRYLERTRRLTIKRPDGTSYHYMIPLSALPDDMQRAYKEAGRLITEIDTTNLPISPIDWLRFRLAKAGYRVSEITGRKEILEYAGPDNATFSERLDSEVSPAGRRVNIDKFNRGDLDVMILNRAGSTGLSLHASSKFKDQRRRRMIIAQAELNIDVHMQMLGRVHRTGQVIPPAFVQAYADVPAEARPAAVLAKKMASLNANTTASRKSAFSADESVDFLNDYGDQVAREYLKENPDINILLEVSLDPEKETARELTGRLLLLPVADQKRALDEITARYKVLIENLDAMGENALEAKTMDLAAKTVGRQELKPAEGDSPFTQAVILEETEVKSVGKALPMPEIIEKAAEALGAGKVSTENLESALNELARTAERLRPAFAKKWTDDFERMAADEIKVTKNEDVKAKRREAHADNRARFNNILDLVMPGRRVTVKAKDGSPLTGIVMNVSRRGQTGATGNPLALGAWSAEIAIPDNAQRITVPFSSMALPGDTVGEAERKVFIEAPDWATSIKNTVEAFDKARQTGKETRYIVTGNILAGFDQTKGNGQIVNYTDDQGNVKPGILMSKTFSPKAFLDERAVRFKTAAQVMTFLKQLPAAEIVSHDEIITVRRADSWTEIEMPAARQSGGTYFLNPDVRKAAYDQFTKVGSRMRYRTNLDESATRVLDAMMKAGAVFQTTDQQEAAEEIIHGKKPGGQAPLSSRAQGRLSSKAKPVATLTGAELMNFTGPQDMRALRLAAQAWYTTNLVPTTATMADGTVVQFNKVGMRESTHGKKGDVLLRAVPAIKAVIEKGTVILREPGNKPHILERIVISAPVNFMGEIKHLAVSVHKMKDGRFQYSFNVDRDAGGPGVGVPGGLMSTRGMEVGLEGAASVSRGETSGVSPEGLARPRSPLPSFEVPHLSPGDLNLFEVSGDFKAGRDEQARGLDDFRPSRQNPYRFIISQKQTARLIADIEQTAERILGHRIARVNVVTNQQEWNELWGEEEDAVFDPNTGIIHIALQGTQDPRSTIRHEAIHALRQAGVITAKEWAVLSRMAQTRWIEQFKIRDRYEQLYRERFDITPAELEQLLIEEAIADAMAEHWARAPGEDLVSRIFARVKAFLEALGNALRGQGFTTASQILEGAERGGMSRRRPGTGQGRDFLLYARQSSRGIELDDRIMGQPGSSTTQVATTSGSYRKAAEFIRSSMPTASRILDYGAGLGLGTDAMRQASSAQVDSYEPFPQRWRGSQPPTFTASNEISGRYEGVVSLNVLNVLEPSIRDQVARDIMQKLAPGGVAVIGTRKFKGDVDQAKGAEPAAERGAVWIRRGQDRVYQKGFDGNELVDYLQGLAPAGYTVERGAGIAANTAIVRAPSGAQGMLSSRRQLRPPRNPTPGSFEAPHDERVRRALFDSTDTLLNRIKRAGSAFGIAGRRKLQDREVDLLRTQAAIEQASGPLTEPKNAYLAASLYPGRVAQRDKDLVEDVVEPLIEDIARRGLTLEQVNDFVMARHAIERNLEVGQIHKPGTQFHEAMTNPTVVGASGMSENEAIAVLQGAVNAGKYADLEAIGDKIVDMNKRTLTKLYTEGLITQEQYDALTTKYQYYVPLRGWDDVTDDSHPETPKTGRRYDIRGREFQQAFGRTTKADSPLAYSIMQARQAIIRIEKNRVGKRFLRLAQAHPNEAFWEVNRVDLKKVIDDRTGYVRNVFDRGAAEAENVYAVKVGGKRYNITLHHEGLLRAMKGIGGENMGDLVGFFHKINRFFAAVNTSYDPEFIFRNFLRDVQQAGIVMQEEKVKGLTRRILASIPKAALGMNQMLAGNLSSQWARYAREFADAGGKIGFMDRADVDAEKRNLEKLMKQANAGWTGKTLMAANELTLERLARWNDTIENTLRLATYVQLRMAGATKDRAAFVARELTVNFNRKGEWGPQINAFYLFFNASMQGAASLFMRLGRSRRMKMIAAGIVVEAFLMDMLNRMIGGDDDDDKNRYDKIPFEEKARNHIFMMPKWVEEQYGVPYFKVPLPLGWNWFNVIGQQASQMTSGVVSPLEAFGNIVGTFVDSVNPLGSGSFLNTAAPTVLDPAVDIGTNKDFFGEDIVPRRFDETTPYAERYNPNVAPAAKWLTDTLSSLTGGSPERPGAIDWSPEWVEHLGEFVFGGIGRFVTRSMSTAEAWLSEEPLDKGKVPFQRVFVGRDSTFADRDEYFQIRDAVHITEKELTARIAEGNREEAARIRRDHAREVKMIDFMDAAEKRLAKLRKDYKATKNALKMGEETRKKRLEAISQEMDEIQLKVRTRWNRLEETAR